MPKKSQQNYMQDMVDGMVPSALPSKGAKKSSGRKPPGRGKKGKPAAKENPYAKSG